MVVSEQRSVYLGKVNWMKNHIKFQMLLCHMSPHTRYSGEVRIDNSPCPFTDHYLQTLSYGFRHMDAL
jgi:hypothetical protein